MSSAAASFSLPGMSAYSISKLVEIRLAEFLHAGKLLSLPHRIQPELMSGIEHSTVRTFAVHPGLVPTDMVVGAFAAQTIDPPELSGGLSLYLSTLRADFLRGKFVSVNWDVNELEVHSSEIAEKKLLNTAFLNADLGPQGHPFTIKG